MLARYRTYVTPLALIAAAVLVYLVWRKHLFKVGGRRPQTDRLGELTDAW